MTGLNLLLKRWSMMGMSCECGYDLMLDDKRQEAYCESCRARYDYYPDPAELDRGTFTVNLQQVQLSGSIVSVTPSKTSALAGERIDVDIRFYTYAEGTYTLDLEINGVFAERSVFFGTIMNPFTQAARLITLRFIMPNANANGLVVLSG